jgi:hypothetical protein
MPRMSAVYLCLAVVALALVGCAPPLYYQTVYWGTFPEQPPDYSPDYTSVPVVAPNGKTRWVLVPKACLVPDATEPPLLGPHLPPGCANTHNLQRMAEHKSDLVRGRPPGAAPQLRRPSGAGVHLWHQGHLGRRPFPAGSQRDRPGLRRDGEARRTR